MFNVQRCIDNAPQEPTSSTQQPPTPRYDLRPRVNRGDICYISIPTSPFKPPPTPTSVLRHIGYTTYSTFEIGRGSFGKVYKAYHADREVAVKVIQMNQIKQSFVRGFIPQERECWSKLRHRNICELYQVVFCPTQNYYFMIMEYCHNGDLLSYLQQLGPLPYELGRRWMGSILDALNYIHKLQCAHRDIKAENILISRRHTVKLADFGFSCYRPNKPTSASYCGSRAYSSPEVLMEVPYDIYKNDIWSLGVLCYVSMTGTLPFPDTLHKNSAIVAQQCRRQYRWPRNISADCRTSIDKLLTFQQNKRPSAKHAKTLPFFHRPDSIALAASQDSVKVKADSPQNVVKAAVNEVDSKGKPFQRIQNFVSKFV